jgi:drug/metabolite transporter (DMT)-like permease
VNSLMFSLIMCGVLLNSGAQIFLKAGMRNIGHFDFTLANFWPISLQVAMSPWIILGLASYVLSVVVWLLVLSRTDVSIAYPMISLGYVVSAMAAYFFLGEHLSLIRMTGIFIILFGVFIVARS